MRSSGLSSPRLQPPEEKSIHHEASTSKNKKDDVVLEIKDDQSDVFVLRTQDCQSDYKAWADSILHANRTFEGEQEPFGMIPLVPESLRQVDNDAFEPNIISIGPYHRGKPRLQPMQKHKRHSVEAILRRNTRKSLADYIREIKGLEIKARSRYSEKINLGSNEFVEMLLFDGCFVVEYLLKGYRRNLKDDVIVDTNLKDDVTVDTSPWMDDAIRNDLLLLENQLPFFVVLRIFELATEDNPFSLMRPTHGFFERVSPINKRGFTCGKPLAHYSLVPHLLHLYHWFLFSSMDNGRDRFLSSNPGNPSEKLKWTIPSATFLEEAGIKFREKMEVTTSLMDATFEDGVMEITPLFINALTVSQFRNLIALEKYDPYIEPQVIAFSQFMDYIINTSKDVALLRKKGIIEHAFGSNEEVATFFNQLTRALEYQPPELTRMYKDVDEYCKTKRHRWRKILMRDYFGSPWAAISLVAAVILISLTFLQTFFSMYAYFKPPSTT